MQLQLIALLLLINSLVSQVIRDQPCWQGLSKEFRHLVIEKIWHARKASTIDSYCYALKGFFSYCQSDKIELILPFSSLSVANYLIFLSETKASKSAMSTAVVALKWLYSFIPGINALNNPLNEDFLTRMVQSESRNRRKLKQRKKPLSNDMVKELLSKINFAKDPSLSELRNALIPCLAYALLLRHDEISHINCNHFSIVSDGLKLFIPSSKLTFIGKGNMFI